VQTPVGARCRACARLRRLPLFEVGAPLLLWAGAAGLAASVVAGLLWAVIPIGGVFSFFVSALAGYGIGEAVSRAAKRRRSRSLKVLAVVGVIVTYVIARSPLLAILPLLVSEAGPAMLPDAAGAIVRRLDLFAWLVIAAGAYVATTRIDA
jgi:hypothetical protein